eukprot:scaffold71993_cov62-Phaeocystis_antarctica.AAC.2
MPCTALPEGPRLAGKSLEIRQRDVVVLVHQPQRATKAEVEEHHAEGPQVVGDARGVLGKLARVHFARLGVGCGEQYLGHLGRAVAR